MTIDAAPNGVFCAAAPLLGYGVGA